MTKSKHTSVHMLIASVAAVFIMSAAAVAQPPAGGKGKGKGARGGGDRPAQGVATRDPAEMATRMIAENDKNGDAELKLEELTDALNSQRQQRGGQVGGQAGARAGREGAKGPGQRQRNGGGAGQGRGSQQGGMQRQRGGPGGKRGGPQAERGGPAGRSGAAGRGGADPAQTATRMLKEFDENGSEGLDAQELAASIKAQRESRGPRGAAGGRADRGQSGTRPRPGRGDADMADGDSPDQRRKPPEGRPGKGKGRAENEDTEPGTGVVPKRPGE